MVAVSLPPWVPGTESKPAPLPLLLVQAFVNTHDIETDTDLLREPESARRWLTGAGLLDAASAVAAEELALTRQAREGVRALLVANGGGVPARPSDLEPLDELARRCRPRLSLGANGEVGLESEPGGGLDGGWSRLLLTIRDAQLDGTWPRLKACGNDDCGWAFYDRSHSRRGRWCDMSSCGNLIKNRNLRTRQRGSREPTAR
ncbi:MAG TPA: ABATE domain-containing protein [Pseudonocardia sp.]|nr:ABATE domain-containing protein [Pseudonocardia sp.]